jgi:small-conductance mechanosensitive channel
MKYVDKINKIISSVTGMEGPYANLIIDTLLIIIFVKIVQKVSNFFFSKIFKKNKTRFNFRKKVSFVCNIFLVFIIIIIWEEFLLKFITLFSFVTAAIAYSLRDTIINFFAGIYIRLAKPFQVEDRIMICNHIGDVVNISNLSFEVLEVNNDTFQSTGSIVHIPNSKVISEPLINYVKVFKYVWNETEVRISIDSDIKKVKGILYSIVNNNDIIKSIPGKMINELNNNSSYRIYYNKLEPIIYTNIKDKYVSMNIRYLVHPKKKRNVINEINNQLLKLNEEGKISLYIEK